MEEIKEKDRSVFSNYDTIVISGGGVKGFILLGGIQAATDHGLLNHLTTYVGTSIGAILSYMLAIGYSPIDIMVYIHNNKWFDKMKNFNTVSMIQGNGATTFTDIYETLEKASIDKIGRLLTLGELEKIYGKKLICATYNMTLSKMEYIGPHNHPEMPCLIAVKMSASLPLIFDRFSYMNCHYIDGGIADNFPIVKALEMGERVIGFSVTISPESLRDVPGNGVIDYISKLLYIPIVQFNKHIISSVKDKCIVISLFSKEAKSYLDFDIDSKSRLEMFSEGYSQTKYFLSDRE